MRRLPARSCAQIKNLLAWLWGHGIAHAHRRFILDDEQAVIITGYVQHRLVRPPAHGLRMVAGFRAFARAPQKLITIRPQTIDAYKQRRRPREPKAQPNTFVPPEALEPSSRHPRGQRKPLRQVFYGRDGG